MKRAERITSSWVRDADHYHSEMQHFTCEWLRRSGSSGEELLLEALLRRGFLAFRDEEGVWLGTGSHRGDLEVLSLVSGLKVEPISGHPDRMARLRLRTARTSFKGVATRIVYIPQNVGFMSDFSYRWQPGTDWDGYRSMAWGTKLPVCPMNYDRPNPLGYDGLDLGIALLVKAFPLARVATGYSSCDGHGSGPAHINFSTGWCELWARAVFEVIGSPTPNSRWDWGRNGASLEVETNGEYSVATALNMFKDIQCFARQLMRRGTIEKIGRARQGLFETFGETEPRRERFAEEAQRQLAVEFERPGNAQSVSVEIFEAD